MYGGIKPFWDMCYFIPKQSDCINVLGEMNNVRSIGDEFF
jgi:hypothetical protein